MINFKRVSDRAQDLQTPSDYVMKRCVGKYSPSISNIPLSWDWAVYWRSLPLSCHRTGIPSWFYKQTSLIVVLDNYDPSNLVQRVSAVLQSRHIPCITTCRMKVLSTRHEIPSRLSRSWCEAPFFADIFVVIVALWLGYLRHGFTHYWSITNHKLIWHQIICMWHIAHGSPKQGCSLATDIW